MQVGDLVRYAPKGEVLAPDLAGQIVKTNARGLHLVRWQVLEGQRRWPSRWFCEPRLRRVLS